jgi:protein AroM
MAGKLGTITIGQAPRSDITPILDAAIGVGAARRHVGLLDGLGMADIEARFATSPGRPLLITRLIDGAVVTIDRQAAEEAAHDKIHELEEDGCTVILLLCTGHFTTLAGRSAWLIEPDRIVPPAVAALAQHRQVGVVVPLESQIATEAEKWASLARPPIYAAASPYAGDDGALADAARSLRARGAELIAMDCMGFVERHRRTVAEAAGCPAVLSNALIAKLTAELV